MRLWTLLATALLPSILMAQEPAAPKPAPDTMVLTDGETLIGHFVRSNGSGVRFKSDILGEVTVEWSKIKELHAAQSYAVVTADLKHDGKVPDGHVSEGRIAVADQKIEVAAPGGPKTIPVAEAKHVIEASEFRKATETSPGFFQDWSGTIAAGATLVEATQHNRTYTEAVTLVRTVPGEDWLPRRNRTTVDVSSSYGTVTQPGTPTVKTSIFHADAEHDEYFSASAYGFGQAQFDHNFSQGLDLQQTYAGGIGWSILRRANEGLDLKAGISYIKQQFNTTGTASQDLISSIFDEKYMRKMWRGSTINQELSVSPAWNNTHALSGLASAGLSIPVYKRFSFTTGLIDNYLNDPPAGFKKNSFQFTTALTYSLR